MITYNKLVRDKIPNIIENNGEKCEVKILEEESFVLELKKKLKEEVDEYMNAQDSTNALEELADILEVIHSLAETHDKSIKDVEKIRQLKLKNHGGFNNRYFLISKQ